MSRPGLSGSAGRACLMGMHIAYVALPGAVTQRGMSFGIAAKEGITSQHRALMPDLDVSALSRWDLYAALGSAGTVTGWGLSRSGLARARVLAAAFFVDGSATLGVGEPGDSFCWGWSLPGSSDWRRTRRRRGPVRSGNRRRPRQPVRVAVIRRGAQAGGLAARSCRWPSARRRTWRSRTAMAPAAARRGNGSASCATRRRSRPSRRALASRTAGPPGCQPRPADIAPQVILLGGDVPRGGHEVLRGLDGNGPAGLAFSLRQQMSSRSNRHRQARPALGRHDGMAAQGHSSSCSQETVTSNGSSVSTARRSFFRKVTCSVA
jgi:hypothetical protein